MARKRRDDELTQGAADAQETPPTPEPAIEEPPVYVISAADPFGIHELLALRDSVRARDPEWAARLSWVIRDFELYGERR